MDYRFVDLKRGSFRLLGNSALGLRNGRRKGPGADMCLSCSKNSKEVMKLETTHHMGLCSE